MRRNRNFHKKCREKIVRLKSLSQTLGLQAAGCLVPCTSLSVYGNPHQTLYTSILGTVQALLLYSDVVDPNKFDLDPDLKGKFASSNPFLTYSISVFN